MKRGLIVPAALVAAIAGLVVVFTWAPWLSRERDREVRWMRGYATWEADLDQAIAVGDAAAIDGCEGRFRTLIGEPPPRFVGATEIVVAECRLLRDAGDGVDWGRLRDEVLWELTDARADGIELRRDGQLAERAAPLASTEPAVFCWPESDWQRLREDWRLLLNDELWLAGFADPLRSQIHLDPDVCEPLHRFFGSSYSPSGNVHALELAQALVVLAHEAEHLRSPEAPEADVECVALQRVRGLVRVTGRGEAYAELMVRLATDVGYPNMPEEYRSPHCRDGGRLDLRPKSTVWP